MFLTYESGISHPGLEGSGGSAPSIRISATPWRLPSSYHPNGLPPHPQFSPWKWRKGARKGHTSLLRHVLEVALISSTHPISHTLATWPHSTLKKATQSLYSECPNDEIKYYYYGRKEEQIFGDNINSAPSSALCLHRKA